MENIKFMSVGNGGFVAANRITSMGECNSKNIQNTVKAAKDEKRCKVIDYSSNKKSRTVIFLDNGDIVISPLVVETITKRANSES